VSPGAPAAQPGSPTPVDGRGDYELQFRKFEKRILRIIFALALLGGVAGWAFAQFAHGDAYPAWALAGAGALAGGAILPGLLWSLMLVAGIVQATVELLNELTRVVPRLVLACGSLYAVYHVYQTLI
jgi:hypothetical protein